MAIRFDIIGDMIIMESGIYHIKNLINDKKYIGQALNLKNRKYNHFNNLKNNKHPNKHLQYSYNKNGKSNFEFKILIYCEPFELTRYEQFFVDLYTPEILYNMRTKCVNSNLGIESSKKGKHISERTKLKISESKKGKSNGKLGLKQSLETKEKIRSRLRGNTNGKTTQFKKGHGGMLGKNNPMYKKNYSDEEKHKISESLKLYWKNKK